MAGLAQAFEEPAREADDDRLSSVRAGLVLVGAGLLYLTLAIGMFATIWFEHGGPASRALGVGGDPQLAIWFLRWQAFAITNGHNLLYTTYLDAPGGVNLMWNTTAPVLGVLLTPLTLTFGAVLAYNVAETLGLALSALAAFVMIRRYLPATDGPGNIAALVGGALYGFSPYMAAHALGHPPLVTLVTPPLMLLLIDDIFVRQRRRAIRGGVALGLLATLQLLLWEELLLAEALVAAVGLAVVLAFGAATRPTMPLSTMIRTRAPYAARALLASLITFGLAAAVPLAIQFFGPQAVHGAVWTPNQFVTDLLAFLVPTPLQAIAPAFTVSTSEHFRASIYEWSGYLGVPLIALLVYATARLRSKTMTGPGGLAAIFAVLGLLIALLSMGPLINVAGRTTAIPVALLALAIAIAVQWRIADTGVRRATRLILYAFLVVWGALIFVPIVSDILPARLMLFVFLFAGLLLAIWLDHALRQARATGRSLTSRALPLALTALALVPLVPGQPFPTTAVDVPGFFTAPSLVGQVPSGSVALVAPFAYDWRLAVPMLWQSASGMRYRMPEGFAWIPGPSYVPHRSALGDVMAAIAKGEPAPALTPAAQFSYSHDLQAWQVKTVIVGPMAHQAEMVRFFTILLSRPPSQEGGVFVWLGL